MSIFDALAALDPTVVATMEAEPGWMWTQCASCGEFRYQPKTVRLGTCVMTPGCGGVIDRYRICTCTVCGKPVTRRRLGADIRFCSRKCEGAS